MGALDPQELLDRAGAAMYAAKAVGKGRVEASTGQATTGERIPLAG